MAESIGDQAWAEMDQYELDIRRIIDHGPQTEDDMMIIIMQSLHLIFGDLIVRIVKREAIEEGVIDP